jgi:GT2 family glycosyltransferase
MCLVTVVITTHNRRRELLSTLERITSLAERPPVIVCDNGSRDGTPDALRRGARGARVIALGRNLGAAARNHGVARARSPSVALSDDDSWWAPGALERAAGVFETHPRLGLLAAHVVVEPDGHDDPTSEAMSRSPLGRDPDLPGPSVLGFIACGAVVRRSAFLAVGGFDPRLLVGGEERLLALNLASAGWGLAYVPEVVAHHRPSARRDVAARERLIVRNDTWTAWLRRPLRVAVAQTLAAGRAALSDSAVRAGLLDAVQGAGWVLRERKPVPDSVERGLLRLEAAGAQT